MIRHIHVRECDTTQDLIKEQLSLSKSDEKLLVSCDVQNAGRGRNTNQWLSLPGTLCFSMTIEPHSEMSYTALEMSLLVTEFFEGSKLELKWPNDIYNVQKKKCCGILVQSFQGRMVAGIGLNLWCEHEEFGGVYSSPFLFDRKAWCHEIASFIYSHRYTSTEMLRGSWEARCSHMGSKVRLIEGNTIEEGFFQGLGPHGEAIIFNESGEKHFYNGSLRVLSSGHP